MADDNMGECSEASGKPETPDYHLTTNKTIEGGGEEGEVSLEEVSVLLDSLYAKAFKEMNRIWAP
jgi:hypothetical protein